MDEVAFFVLCREQRGHLSGEIPKPDDAAAFSGLYVLQEEPADAESGLLHLPWYTSILE